MIVIACFYGNEVAFNEIHLQIFHSTKKLLMASKNNIKERVLMRVMDMKHCIKAAALEDFLHNE